MNQWFMELSSTWFRSDGSIGLDLSEDHLLLTAHVADVIKPVEALADIDTGETAECFVLEFRNDEYLDGAQKILVFNALGPDIVAGDQFIAVQPTDGNWLAIFVDPDKKPLLGLGFLDTAMSRGQTVPMTFDDGTQQSVLDPGQIPSNVTLKAGNRVTATFGERGAAGWLISYDCDNKDVATPPPGPPGPGPGPGPIPPPPPPPPPPPGTITYYFLNPNPTTNLNVCLPVGQIDPALVGGTRGRFKLPVDINHFIPSLPRNVIWFLCG